jgi:type I restriction enzyme M protein
VDTFEPEEEIDLKQAIAEFKATLNQETALDKTIDELLKVLN